MPSKKKRISAFEAKQSETNKEVKIEESKKAKKVERHSEDTVNYADPSQTQECTLDLNQSEMSSGTKRKKRGKHSRKESKDAVAIERDETKVSAVNSDETEKNVQMSNNENDGPVNVRKTTKLDDRVKSVDQVSPKEQYKEDKKKKSDMLQDFEKQDNGNTLDKRKNDADDDT